jgi:hypothetical protein
MATADPRDSRFRKTVYSRSLQSVTRVAETAGKRPFKIIIAPIEPNGHAVPAGATIFQ